MPGDWKQALEARLADVPKGELLVCAKSDTLFFSPPACACIGQDDKGRLDIWPLYPGVELTLQAYSAKFVAFHHDVPGAPLLEINHCYAGRVAAPATQVWRCISAREIFPCTGCTPAWKRSCSSLSTAIWASASASTPHSWTQIRRNSCATRA